MLLIKIVITTAIIIIKKCFFSLAWNSECSLQMRKMDGHVTTLVAMAMMTSLMTCLAAQLQPPTASEASILQYWHLLQGI